MFGVAGCRIRGSGPEWRVLKRVMNGMPQICGDTLNTHLG
ncbi:hypothetical protein ACQF36_02170 [Streptomyces sp. Marseille-Q5077]